MQKKSSYQKLREKLEELQKENEKLKIKVKSYELLLKIKERN